MLPQFVTLVEVGPRDGLQSEPDIMATETKVEFINRLIDCGLRRIEVTSFVHPERVPQMADAEAVLAAMNRPEDLAAIGLVLNERGFDRAVNAGVDEIGFVIVASNTFNQRNQGVTTDQSVATWKSIARRADEAGIPANVMISAAFGCPFEGVVCPERVLDLAREALDQAPAAEIALADTIGAATPWKVRDLVTRLCDEAGDLPVRCHFHNTRNTGIANACAALEAGASRLDASAGGIGGCPFAPAATGNIATEDLLYVLEHETIETGVNLEAVIATAEWLGEVMQRPVPSMVSRAGDFPRVARG